MLSAFRIKGFSDDDAFKKWVMDTNARESFFVRLKVYVVNDIVVVDSSPLMFNTAPLFALFSLACFVFGWNTMAIMFAGVFLLMYGLQSKALYYFTMVKALKKVGSQTRIGWE